MKESVIQHALQHAWANPNEDSIARIKPARVTGRNGELVSFKFLHDRYLLPSNKGRFHVYHLGIYPNDDLMSTHFSRYKWLRLDELVTAERILFHAYTDDGMFIHNDDVYGLLTPDGGLLLAIKKQKYSDIYVKNVYIRFQHNEFYLTTSMESKEVSVSSGGYVNSPTELISTRQKIEKYRKLPGHVFVYQNGYLSNSRLVNEEVIGSNLSFVYDSSIKAQVEFKLEELDTFDSVKDLNTKYLLHPKTGQLDLDDAVFVDDVDFYLLHRAKDGTERGTLIYKHKSSDASSVTYRDWAINYDLVQFLLDITKPISEYYIKAFVRHSGQSRRITYSENLVKEMYKMTETDIYGTLTNHNHLLEQWTAATLENSEYMRLLSSEFKHLDANVVLRGYGYDSICSSMARNVLKKEEAAIPLGPALNENTTVFEYDIAGNFIDFHFNPGADSYIPNNGNCRAIQVNYGKPSTDWHYFDSNTQDLHVHSYDDVRVFDCPIVNGEPTREFVEITNDSSKYIIENGFVKWFIDLDGRYAVVVTNRNLKIQTFRPYIDDGLVELDISSETGLAPASTDVYLGRKYLASGIDYVRKENKILICNVDYINYGDFNDITVVCKGIASDVDKHVIAEKSGFLVNGKMGVDEQYDLKDSKNLHCFIQGRLIPQETIAWEEDGTGSTRNDLNGFPYVINDAYVALPKLVDYDHFPRRERSREYNQLVSELFTGLGLVEKQDYPEVNTDYEIFSPFMSHILVDIVKGRRDPLDDTVTDSQVEQWCEPYFRDLEFDPCRLFTARQMQFVKILPTMKRVTTVDSKTYSFLNRINSLYLYNRIILRDNVVIG